MATEEEAQHAVPGPEGDSERRWRTQESDVRAKVSSRGTGHCDQGTGAGGVGADLELRRTHLLGLASGCRCTSRQVRELRSTSGWRKKLRNRWPRDNL